MNEFTIYQEKLDLGMLRKRMHMLQLLAIVVNFMSAVFIYLFFFEVLGFELWASH
jgi:hypothetical protein